MGAGLEEARWGGGGGRVRGFECLDGIMMGGILPFTHTSILSSVYPSIPLPHNTVPTLCQVCSRLREHR